MNVLPWNPDPIGTSDNDVGYIDYYMMLRVTNHFDANTTNQFAPVGEFANNQDIDEQAATIQQIFDSYFDITQFQKTTIPSYRFELNQNIALIPTIIADFRNPTYSVSIDDANIDLPGGLPGSQEYEGKLPFPFPGQYNPTNDPNKAPNFGTHFL